MVVCFYAGVLYFVSRVVLAPVVITGELCITVSS